MINVYDIQPCEEYLAKSAVDYFLQNPGMLFKEKPKIVVYICEGLPFKYCVLEGNTRLFVCHKLNMSDIELVPEIPPTNDYFSYIKSSLEVYNLGIRSWKDLEDKVLSDKEYEAYLERLMS
jgi:hypothetical protein